MLASFREQSRECEQTDSTALPPRQLGLGLAAVQQPGFRRSDPANHGLFHSVAGKITTAAILPFAVMLSATIWNGNIRTKNSIFSCTSSFPTRSRRSQQSCVIWCVRQRERTAASSPVPKVRKCSGFTAPSPGRLCSPLEITAMRGLSDEGVRTDEVDGKVVGRHRVIKRKLSDDVEPIQQILVEAPKGGRRHHTIGRDKLLSVQAT